MKKILGFALALTAATCMVACEDDTGTNTPVGQNSEREVGPIDDSGSDNNLVKSSDSKNEEGAEQTSDSSSSGVAGSTEETGKSSSSSAKSSAQSSSSEDPLAKTVWSWDTPKEKFLNSKITYRTWTDKERDHKTYKVFDFYQNLTTKYTWFAENLDYEMDGSWCYDNDPEKCKLAGRLYTWDAATKACPEGWRLPSEEDWNMLMIEGLSKAGTILKSETGWAWKNNGTFIDGNGENSLGFSAIPAGLWTAQEETYANAGMVAFFWSSTEKDDDEANSVTFSGDSRFNEEALLGAMPKNYGFSVRCVQDGSDEE